MKRKASLRAFAVLRVFLASLWPYTHSAMSYNEYSLTARVLEAVRVHEGDEAEGADD